MEGSPSGSVKRANLSLRSSLIILTLSIVVSTIALVAFSLFIVADLGSKDRRILKKSETYANLLVELSDAHIHF